MRLCFMLMACLCAQVSMAQSPAAKAKDAMDALARDPQMTYASYSFYLINGQTGQKIWSVNENMGLAPASCLKVLTAAATLHTLGDNYQYKTRLAYEGQVDAQGVLQGNLVIKGAGDPSLGSTRYQASTETAILQSWLAAIKKAGIKKINGQIIGDDSIFDTQTVPDGWIWQDMGNYYGAGPSGLNWRENQFDIQFQPGTVAGAPTALSGTKPAMPYLTLINELRTGPKGSGDQAYAYIAPYAETGYVRGTAGLDERNFSISAAVPDPAFDAAYRLQQALAADNITTTKEPATTRRLMMTKAPLPQKLTTLMTTLSPSLDKLVYWFLRKSVNLYGESFVKTLALQSGEQVSTAAGVQLLKEYCQQLGMNEGAVNIIDGSGLSPANRVTTTALATVLYNAQKQPWFAAYYEALPESNGIKMKDGYIGGVRSYTGFIKPKQGPPLVFAFIVNNFSGGAGPMRQKMWKVLDSLK
ncbi:D-alanyl-D-alanine carboxypeptidase/D-alanyl-D-alanine-endopeptidase [Chitinophaga sedimenti]|uniref:D-alanyl-D-alanine carboxypeptidase/D-alanyl-D-alanine endopeptidase n=1 Tax=Chitinophaga sedimenti TaxID=2033606 RepID=UPI0020068306|nr:D-alanyl-D-alanine carboxypeptidase/D-alanyl-D-alanine-endopeptidase [Chitinophaga sedimenti]MCK7556663.1 D-alanyl-D-alanine carboxypeptidase/D-alanyl-D-alanine-endopeptidase [Chitinophaga sedimenti]